MPSDILVCDHLIVWMITNSNGVLYTCHCHLLDAMWFSGSGRADKVYDPSKLCGANRTFPAGTY